MSRNAKIGCAIFTGVVTLLLIIGIGAFFTQVSQYGATQNAQATATAQAQMTSDAAAALLAQDTPTDTPTPAPTLKSQPTRQAVQPTAQPTHRATPLPTPVYTGINGNPWGYDFNTGNLIYSPPSNFCDYFNCISSFWNGSGFVNECQDGSYSLSGGHQGDCSHHGGEFRPLYSH